MNIATLLRLLSFIVLETEVILSTLSYLKYTETNDNGYWWCFIVLTIYAIIALAMGLFFEYFLSLQFMIYEAKDDMDNEINQDWHLQTSLTDYEP